MALRHVLLSVLNQSRASGYELARRFERTPWRFAWHAQHSQIYPELERMADDGLILVAARGSRRRRIYTITRAGQDELRSWLMDAPATLVVRNELVVRLFALLTLDPADARTVLAPIAAAIGAELAKLRALAADADATATSDDGVPWERLTTEFSLRSVEALDAWVQGARAALDGVR